MVTAGDVDVVVVGAGLAGLVTTRELVQAGLRVALLDQEGEADVGGQAQWSLGGLFLVDSPEQRRMGIRDSERLALTDWFATARFDRSEDEWARQWAEAYVSFAAHEKRDYMTGLGLRLIPLVGWAERGAGRADGPGNSVPRFHLAWGGGPEIVRVFLEPVLEAAAKGQVTLHFRHRVDDLVVEDGAAVGVRGSHLATDHSAPGAPSNRVVVGDFDIRARSVVVTSGGIGHNHDLIRRHWPTERLGPPPAHLISGVPAYVDGRLLEIAERAGARAVNRDRLWCYVEGVHNWDPIWPDHAIRILAGPSSLWLDADGRRLPPPNYPGHDTLGTLEAILATGHDYSWLVLDRSIVEKEFVLSGSEQNPDLTGKDFGRLVRARLGKDVPGPIRDFLEKGEDFVVAYRFDDLVDGMNRLGRGGHIDGAALRETIETRDLQIDNAFTKDAQVMSIHNARKSRSDRLARVAEPHHLMDPAHGPFVAVRLNIMTRKTLGGLQTNLDSQVMRPDGTPYPGLYAAGEVAGFGGGGMHGYAALEGTFLGGCIFSGLQAGRALARRLKG